MVAGNKEFRRVVSLVFCLFFAMVACHKVFRFFICLCEGGGLGVLGFIDPCLV